MRRPVHKPVIRDKAANPSRIIRLLAKLIANEKHISIVNAINSYKQDIQDVIDCMWNELTLKYELLEHGKHYDTELHKQVKDKDEVKMEFILLLIDSILPNLVSNSIMMYICVTQTSLVADIM